MTLADIQLDIALDADTNSSAPATNTTDYIKRTKLINRFERLWRDAKPNGKWAVLLKSTTLTTTQNVAYVALPSGYKRGRGLFDEAGYIKLNNRRYKLINLDHKDSYDDSELLCWITGSDAEGYRIYFNPTPDDAYSFPFNYYTKNTATASDQTTEKEVLVDETDITKCPNHLYLVYGVLSVLAKTETVNQTLGQDYEQMAEEVLQSMIVDDYMGEINQENKIDEPSYINGLSPMGGQDYD